MFIALATAAWGVGWTVAFLDSVHSFQPGVLHLLHNVELWLLYIDIGLSGSVLVLGAYRFILEIGGRR